MLLTSYEFSLLSGFPFCTNGVVISVLALLVSQSNSFSPTSWQSPPLPSVLPSSTATSETTVLTTFSCCTVSWIFWSDLAARLWIHPPLLLLQYFPSQESSTSPVVFNSFSAISVTFSSSLTHFLFIFSIPISFHIFSCYFTNSSKIKLPRYDLAFYSLLKLASSSFHNSLYPSQMF